jgi:hypothetical protein
MTAGNAAFASVLSAADDTKWQLTPLLCPQGGRPRRSFSARRASNPAVSATRPLTVRPPRIRSPLEIYAPGMGTLMRLPIALTLLTVGSVCAQAANISVTPSEGTVLVFVDGDLGPTDADDFKSKTSFLSKAIIVFRSDGGNVIAGIQIGESIRLKAFTTFVPENARCASACALAWLGGTQRFMASGAQIGFHAAYNAKSGQETGVGNAIVGAYLNKIGLPYEAVIYITQAAPSSMTWLSVSEAIKRGIDVAMLAPSSTASTVGPPVSASSEKPRDLEARVSNLVGSLFVTWSSPNVKAIKGLEGLYEDTVMYYGKATSRDAVLSDKRRFADRWPQRSYTIRPGTLFAQCEGVRCAVSGTTDWAAAKDARRSTGVANFEYVVLLEFGGILKIAEETSKVVQGPIISAHVPGNPPWATNKTPCTTDGTKILRQNAEEAGVCHN